VGLPPSPSVIPGSKAKVKRSSAEASFRLSALAPKPA
jgi:hypothetical protein